MKKLFVSMLIALTCLCSSSRYTSKQQIEISIPKWVSDTGWYIYQETKYAEEEAQEWDSLVALYPNLNTDEAYELVYNYWNSGDDIIFFRACRWYDDTGCLDPNITWSATLARFREEYGKSFPECARTISERLAALESNQAKKTGWPTPDEVRRDLGIPEPKTDLLMAFTFDSTLAFELLNAVEIAILDSARLAYFEAVRDSFPDLGPSWWGSCVRSWLLYQVYDSLKAIGKSPETYYQYLLELNYYYSQDMGLYRVLEWLWLSTHGPTPKWSIDLDSVEIKLDSLAVLNASLGWVPRPQSHSP